MSQGDAKGLHLRVQCKLSLTKQGYFNIIKAKIKRRIIYSL